VQPAELLAQQPGKACKQPAKAMHASSQGKACKQAAGHAHACMSTFLFFELEGAGSFFS
jgi:hypothetical protein